MIATPPTETESSRLLALLTEKAACRMEVTLSSGKKSDRYIDCKQVTMDQDGAELVGKLLLDSIRDEQVSAAGGLETGAIPMTLALLNAARGEDIPLKGFWVRKTAKAHGKMLDIEGPLRAGARVIIVDDVLTTGDSALRAVQKVQELGCHVVKVVALVDREEGAAELFQANNVPFESLYKASQLFR